MRSKRILATLKEQAYNNEANGLGDALGDLVHWIAAHEDNMRSKDREVLMSVCLALYKNELEKNWDISSLEEASAAAAAAAADAEARSSSEIRVGQSEETSAIRKYSESESYLAAEQAVEALVALRRPVAPVEPQAAARGVDPTKRGRRWTDNECWSLTLRV